MLVKFFIGHRTTISLVKKIRERERERANKLTWVDDKQIGASLHHELGRNHGFKVILHINHPAQLFRMNSRERERDVKYHGSSGRLSER